VRVFPLHSNVLAPLFADAGGTIPLANPVTTNASGVATFWAEQGEYWLHADSEAFQVPIGLTPVTPGAFAALQAEVDAAEADIAVLQAEMNTAQGDIAALQTAVTNLQADIIETDQIASLTVSTGVSAGGQMSVNGGNPAAIDIAPLTGYVTDFNVDPFNPTVIRVEYPGGTVAMDAGALARTATAWLMDVDQNIIQQATPPTNAQRRELLFLGVTAQVGGSIIVDQTLPVILQQPANQLTDLMTALGAFNIAGNLITPNGVNLSINQSAGTVFSQAFNHFAGPIQTDDPHVSTTMAQTPAQFRYVTRSSPTFGPLTSLIDVANFDVGGVVTPVGGGANTTTIHRVYLFPNNTATEQLVIQYGQTAYSSLANAVAAIGAGTFVPNPLMRAAALLAYIAVTRTAVNLSDPTQASITHAGKFANP
jgi:hypothetical protein